MKTKKINLANNPEKEEICLYLNGTFEFRSKMEDSRKLFEENRLTEKHEAYKEQNTKDVVATSDASNAWTLFLKMSMGIKEAAYYLAVSFLEGYGVIKNEFLMYLTMAIGVKLKDSQTIEYVGDEKIPSNAIKLADKCIPLIMQAAKAVKGRDITYEEAIGWGKCLDKIVIQETKHSFETNILDTAFKKAGAPYVEVDMAGEHHHCEIC